MLSADQCLDPNPRAQDVPPKTAEDQGNWARFKQGAKLATLQSPQKGVLGPFGPKVGKGVENEFPGLPAPGPNKLNQRQKRVRKVEKELKESQKVGNFDLFGPRGGKAPGTHFQLRFQLWARFDSFSILTLTFLDPAAGRPQELIFNSVSNYWAEGKAKQIRVTTFAWRGDEGPGAVMHPPLWTDTAQDNCPATSHGWSSSWRQFGLLGSSEGDSKGSFRKGA